MAYATVPAEILTGQRHRAADPDPRPLRAHGRDARALADADPGLPDARHGDVHARRLRAHLRKHALPLDLRRQPRGRARARAVPRLLPADRGARGTLARRGHRRARGESRSSRASAPRARSRACSAATSCSFRSAASACSGSTRSMEVPALVAIGLWFVFQLVSGAGMLGGEMGGVAYGAHIGGFVAGVVLVKLFGGDRRPALSRVLRPARQSVLFEHLLRLDLAKALAPVEGVRALADHVRAHADRAAALLARPALGGPEERAGRCRRRARSRRR